MREIGNLAVIPRIALVAAFLIIGGLAELVSLSSIDHGHIRTWYGAILADRARSPVAFWCGVAVQQAVVVLFIGLAVWSGVTGGR